MNSHLWCIETKIYWKSSRLVASISSGLEFHKPRGLVNRGLWHDGLVVYYFSFSCCALLFCRFSRNIESKEPKICWAKGWGTCLAIPPSPSAIVCEAVREHKAGRPCRREGPAHVARQGPVKETVAQINLEKPKRCVPGNCQVLCKLSYLLAPKRALIAIMLRWCSCVLA